MKGRIMIRIKNNIKRGNEEGSPSPRPSPPGEGETISAMVARLMERLSKIQRGTAG
jgi:hypothetical protein